jgi:hypothetical protein
MTHAMLAQSTSRGFTLRAILNLDGLSCAAMALLLVFGSAALAPLLGAPQALLFWAGVVLFPCAALMFTGARHPHPMLVWTLILGNAAWVLASIAVTMLFELTWPGMAFVLAQAMFVAALAVLEWRALRASR